jgi:hypothetical protein
MEYYLYVSDTKVNMIYDQMPTPLREKVATELKIDLKFLSTTFSEALALKNRYMKLDVVANYIRQDESVGTVDEPDVYFEGTLPMRWGGLPGDGPKTNTVIFTGKISDARLVLGGSNRFVLGEEVMSGGSSPSSLGRLLSRLVVELSYAVVYEANPSMSKLIDSYVFDPQGIEALINFATEISFPMQRLEFLAKRLHFHKRGSMSYLIGTPIYVALAE